MYTSIKLLEIYDVCWNRTKSEKSIAKADGLIAKVLERVK